MIGTIEPWHGSTAVVYRRSDGAWARTVVDESITDGHTMATGDFDGDARLDVVCVGTATANVKWYENRR